ncbi:MAG: hypothetical protein P4M05_03375, partial [Bradyrhizobium sp.]|nr:hypothetical protein [Bradyrhizobium sp.]
MDAGSAARRCTLRCIRGTTFSFERATPPVLQTVLPDGQIAQLSVQSLPQKYSGSLQTQITSTSIVIPAHTEGRFAIVTDV